MLDGGACPVGLESTIVGFDGGAPGAAPPRRPAGRGARPRRSAARSPRPPRAGDHRARPARLALRAARGAAARRRRAGAGEICLGFGPGRRAGLNLSAAGDLAEAAANLFAHLRAADALAARAGATGIAVAPIPREGLGRAINDRLARAAAPRG